MLLLSINGLRSTLLRLQDILNTPCMTSHLNILDFVFKETELSGPTRPFLAIVAPII